MLSSLAIHVRRVARSLALGGAGGLLALGGFGFLSAGAFLWLRETTDPVTACLVVGSTLTGVGLLLMALAAGGRDPQADAPRPPLADHPAPATPLASAFMDGVERGMAAGRRSH